MGLFGRPELSVVIPCYNAERYIDACLSSVCGQALSAVQILCVDDGSTDGTAEALLRWQKRDGRIRVIRQENRGVSAARNAGLRLARGTFVYFLDSDDEIADRETLAECCRQMRENRTDVLVGAARTVYESDELARRYPEFAHRYEIALDYPGVMTGLQAIGALRTNREWTVPPATKLLRRSYLKQNRLAFPEGIIHEDGLFTFRAFYLAERVQVTRRALYLRRIREDSIMTGRVTHRNTLGYLTNLIEGLRLMEKYRGSKPISPVTGSSVSAAAHMAAESYAQLDADERSALKRAMTEEQRFYFAAFVRREAKLLEEKYGRG